MYNMTKEEAIAHLEETRKELHEMIMELERFLGNN